MFNAGSFGISIAEVKTFVDEAKSVFTEKEYEDLILFLAEHPDAGEVIQGTGGVRKLRWRAKGHGKRGGARVIYYFRDLNMPVYLLAVYSKGEKMNLTEAEKRQMREIVEIIVANSMNYRVRVVRRN